MHAHDNINESLPFLAVANPDLVASGDPAWDQAFAEYLSRDGLARADAYFGRFAEANREYDIIRESLVTRFGEGGLRAPGVKPAFDKAWHGITSAEDKRHQEMLAPMWAAAIALTRVPAPNLAAVLFKIELIRREELDNDQEMTDDPFDIIAADFARLGGAR